MPEFFATAPFEMEGVVAQELRDLGFQNVRPQSGKVAFDATFEQAFFVNLWSRTADRVLLHVGSFPAKTFDELFQGVQALPWETYLPRDAVFPVSGKCAKSTLMSVPDCQAITKKAVSERLKSHYGLAWMPETGARFAIDVHLHGDIAVLTIDTSGAGLAKRGYRTYNGDAPLRETLAAALLRLSFWYPDMPLCDPMCGTGTIAIEAAMIAADRAPGLNRSFDMEAWRLADDQSLAALRQQAQDRFLRDLKTEIFASDIDAKAVALTKKHVKLAGMDWKIQIRKSPFDQLSGLPDRGCFVVNPPYGVRLMDRRQIETLYAQMGRWYRDYPFWSLTVFTACRDFERLFGARAQKKRRIFNGKLECGAYAYRGARREKPTET